MTILPYYSVSLFQALIMGAVQALAEFLPVSSSGHLVLISNFLSSKASPLFFDVILHFGTAAALLVVFYKDLLKIIKALFFDFSSKKLNFSKYSTDSFLGFFIVIACIPAVFVGLFFGDFIEQTFRDVKSVMLFLFLGTLLMILAELFTLNKKSTEKISTSNALVVGVLQVLALFPGFSRSGATISAGMLSGLSRKAAARFSFLLSIPLVLAAGVFEIGSSLDMLSEISLQAIMVGFFTSFLVGVVVIKFLLKFLTNHSLWVFIFYRIILLLVLLIFI